MPAETRIVSPGPNDRAVRTADGKLLAVPVGWILVPPGDAALTRRLKAAGPTWTVQEKKGRKTFSRGLWTAAATVEQIRTDLERERATESYTRKRASATVRREKKQTEYVGDFHSAVLHFLAFTPDHHALADRLAQAVTRHATPVGSGTVARTQRIPIERRAEAAVVAWLRHQTTAYDDMKIPRIRGKRREVRRQLAGQSRKLLDRYRRGTVPLDSRCPIAVALKTADAPTAEKGAEAAKTAHLQSAETVRATAKTTRKIPPEVPETTKPITR